MDTETSACAEPGQAQVAVCGTIYKTGGTEPLSPPSVGEFIVLVHDRWEVGGHREKAVGSPDGDSASSSQGQDGV